MPADTSQTIAAAVATLGPAPLAETSLQHSVAPLFARVRAASGRRVYLANHSLGRPLDSTADDVREGLDAWYANPGNAWDAWSEQLEGYRARFARLLAAPAAHCVVPKTSAGQGLRAILNTYDRVARVVATSGEFDSLDVILREYARRGRIALSLVQPGERGRFETPDVMTAIGSSVDLVVMSDVIFNTGQRIERLADIVAATHAAGGRILLDVYHSLGVYPVDVQALDVDFAVGGSYKYLRGGPGACFLYLDPRHLDGSLRTLDIGWFAKQSPFEYSRPEPPLLGEGGDAFLESTPPVLMTYQSRAGQLLALGLGPSRLRAYSLDQQRFLCQRLAAQDVVALGGTEDRGAFVVIVHERAVALSEALRARDVITDVRGPYLRLCPDILTTRAEMDEAASALGQAVKSL